MNYPFILTLVLLFMASWALVSYFFVRINRQTRIDKQAKSIQPAFRLADQWIMESQRKIEKFIEDAVSPLGNAQHELLELRLEAGRLPQGVKNLRDLRESLVSNIHPVMLDKPLAQIVALYLIPENHQVEELGFVYLKTDMGLVPVLEATRTASLSDQEMKRWLSHLSTHANPTMGGFLYFASEAHYQVFEANKEWVDALRNHRLMALDFKGLTALLISLKVSHETNRMLKVFDAGVQSTIPLVGNVEKMERALASLSSGALNAQMILEGRTPQAEAKNEP